MPTLQSIPLSASTIGDNVIITGNALTPTIQVLAIYFQCNITTTVTIKAGTTSLTGAMSFTGGGGLNLPNNGNVYYEVDSGGNFIIHLSGITGQVGGQVMYYQF